MASSSVIDPHISAHISAQIDLANVKSLDSYDDRNFYVRQVNGDGKTTGEFTFKIHNGVESDAQAIIEGQSLVGVTLAENGINSSCPQKGLYGEYITWAELPLKNGKIKRHAVRLLAWVRGICMVSADVNLMLLYKAGKYLGKVRQSMDGLDHPGFHREHFWDINSTAGILRFVHCIQDEDARKVVRGVVTEFNEEIAPLAIASKQALEDGGTCVQLRWGVLMADFNDANIIVNEDETDVSGVIDFGDSVYSCRVYDIAIGVAYAMLGRYGKHSPIAAGSAMLKGFMSVYELTFLEKELLPLCIACRLATSATSGAYSLSQDPNNEYLKLHAVPALKALMLLRSMDKQVLSKALFSFPELSV